MTSQVKDPADAAARPHVAHLRTADVARPRTAGGRRAAQENEMTERIPS
jgi:hypothetical protein